MILAVLTAHSHTTIAIVLIYASLGEFATEWEIAVPNISAYLPLIVPISLVFQPLEIAR